MADTKTSEVLVITTTETKSKGKAIHVQAYYRARGLQDVVIPRISRQSAHECGKVVSPKHRLSRSQDHSVAGRFMSIKIPMTPAVIKLATFRFVAQCLSQLRHRVALTVLCWINQIAGEKYFTHSKDSIVNKSNSNVLIWTITATTVQGIIVRLTKDRLS